MNETSDRRAVYPSLRGKNVLITGGGSGIGAGTVEAFARQGANTAFIDICEEPSREVGTKTGAKFLCVDLRDIPATKQAIAELEQERGPTNVLINNAANDDRHSFDEVTEDYWDERVNTNLKHQFFCAQAVVPAMRKNGGGVILNLGSISWHLALPDLVLYQTCKAAIEGLTRSLARDLGPDGIRVNCIVPGNVRTLRQLKWYSPEAEAELVDAQCLKGRLLPEDVAAMALFLASDDAHLVTGHAYFVDAGWR